MSIAESFPLIITRRLDLLYTLNRGHCNYKSIAIYNMGNSLPKLSQPWKHFTYLIYFDSFTRIPLISMSLYKTLNRKSYLAKKIQGYILAIIFIICKLS